jgi:hypothetical protein
LASKQYFCGPIAEISLNYQPSQETLNQGEFEYSASNDEMGQNYE